jgi:hypothetical protein
VRLDALDRTRFDGAPLNAWLHLINGSMDALSCDPSLSIAPPTFPPEKFFQRQAASIRACSADLRRMRDYIPQNFGSKRGWSIQLFVLYAYCSGATQTRLHERDLASLLNWAKRLVPELVWPDDHRFDSASIKQRLWEIQRKHPKSCQQLAVITRCLHERFLRQERKHAHQT